MKSVFQKAARTFTRTSDRLSRQSRLSPTVGLNIGDQRASVGNVARAALVNTHSDYQHAQFQQGPSSGASPIPEEYRTYTRDDSPNSCGPLDFGSLSTLLFSPGSSASIDSTQSQQSLTSPSPKPLFFDGEQSKTPERPKRQQPKTPATNAVASNHDEHFSSLPLQHINHFQIRVEDDARLGKSVQNFDIINAVRDNGDNGMLFKTNFSIGEFTSIITQTADAQHCIKVFLRPNGYIYIKPPVGYALTSRSGQIRMDYKNGILSFLNLRLVRSTLNFRDIKVSKKAQQINTDQQHKISHPLDITLFGKVGQPLVPRFPSKDNDDEDPSTTTFGKVGQPLVPRFPFKDNDDVDPSTTTFGKVGQPLVPRFPSKDNDDEDPSTTTFGKVGQPLVPRFPSKDNDDEDPSTTTFGKVGQPLVPRFPSKDNDDEDPSTTTFGKVGQPLGPSGNRRGEYGKCDQSLKRQAETVMFNLDELDTVISSPVYFTSTNYVVTSTNYVGQAYKFDNVLLFSFNDPNIVPSNHDYKGLNLVFKKNRFVENGAVKTGYFLDLREFPLNGDIELQQSLFIAKAHNDETSYRLSGLNYTEVVQVIKKRTIDNGKRRSNSTPPKTFMGETSKKRKRARANSVGGEGSHVCGNPAKSLRMTPKSLRRTRSTED